jgi:hypothetical protein
MKTSGFCSLAGKIFLCRQKNASNLLYMQVEDEGHLAFRHVEDL